MSLNKGEWNSYVESGETREIRRARLEEAPEEWRESISDHVKTVFFLKAHKDHEARRKKVNVSEKIDAMRKVLK